MCIYVYGRVFMYISLDVYTCK